MSRNCENDPDRFCFICVHVVFLDTQAKIMDLVKKKYEEYFGVRQIHQDMPFAPLICCKTCLKNLLNWKNKKRKKMTFSTPMKKMKDHITDCYFYMTTLKGINRKNKNHFQYPDVPSATKPVPHGPELPVPNVNIT